MAEQEKPVTWVVAAVMGVIALFGWAFMAATFAHDEEGWRAGGVGSAESPRGYRRATRAAFADFVTNAIFQVPKAPSVIAFNVRNKLWVPLTILSLEGLALFGGYKLKALEIELARPPRTRR